MKIIVVGLNHNTAAVDVREKLAFNGPRLEEGLLKIRELPDIEEVVVLSTCNRVELYADVRDIGKSFETISMFLSKFHGIDRDSLQKSLYLHNDSDAVRHIFRVASSLDSMVVGEPQILGQLKDAFDCALRRKTTGIFLNKLMKKAISVAKRVRTETKIAENAVSISFAAVELARKIFTDLSEKSFMLLGAGEMAELAARHMVNCGVKDVTVVNRTYERGCELATEFNGRAVNFEDFPKELVHTDILFCSTGAPTYVLQKEEMQRVMKERRQRSVFIIDISVPRNIDPEINNLDNVYLYNVDDLQGTVDANILERKKEAERAEAIVEEEIESFQKWMSSLDSVPTVVALRNKAEAIKREEMERLLNKFPELGEKERKAIEYMASAITKKLIHPPTVALKENAEDREMLIATIRKLYGINGEEE
ncbi:MAG TPA: glutamyl-tRNA reductase [Nitrospiraceae bacterium]|jgi:glutamyl-tRNA reductase|nr:glutamyl-tRNA reductase [Nitrospiraceae bacterium]